MFAEMLRRSPRLLHLRAEVSPFLVLAGLTWPHVPSDALEASHAATGDLVAGLSAECGTPDDDLSTPTLRERFARDLAGRLALQWPLLDIPLPAVSVAMESTLDRLVRTGGWTPGRFVDPQLFHAHFLAELRRDFPAVDPWLYDLDRGLVAATMPEATPRRVAPECVIEEPPFVTIRPWRPASLDELDRLPVAIKTPGNAYRHGFWRALFSASDLRMIHLTRNVAASVNGLYDGWRYCGFFAHPMPGRLAIDGYSHGEPSEDWWKFDLAPGWERFTRSPLEQVCAHQWRAAHRALLSAWAHVPSIRLRFEDVVGAPDVRGAAFAGLERWLGTDLSEAHASAMPVVMATEQPRHRRWFARATLLESVLADGANRQLMAELGYDPDPAGWG
jgi:hypothetical protein